MSLYSPQMFPSPIILQLYLQISNKDYGCCMTHSNSGEHNTETEMCEFYKLGCSKHWQFLQSDISDSLKDK